MQPIHSQN